MNTKRPWTRTEKSLVVLPLLIVLAAGGTWLWSKKVPRILVPPNGNSTSPIGPIEWSPDGRQLVVISMTNLGQDQGAVYNTISLSKICDLQSIGTVNTEFGFPSWSPDGSQLVTGYEDGSVGNVKTKSGFNSVGKIALWNARTGRLIARWPYASKKENSVAVVKFSRHKPQLIGEGAPPAIFDAISGARLRHFSNSTRGGSFNANENMLAVVDENSNRVEVREVNSDRILWKTPVNHAFEMEWSKQDVLGIQDRNKENLDRLLLWDGKKRRVLPKPPTNHVDEFSLNSSRPLVAVAEVGRNENGDNTSAQIFVWNYRTRRIVWSRKMDGAPNLVAWSPDGLFLASTQLGGTDSSINIWNADGKLINSTSFGAAYKLRWSPKSEQLAVGGEAEVLLLRVNH